TYNTRATVRRRMDNLEQENQAFREKVSNMEAGMEKDDLHDVCFDGRPFSVPSVHQCIGRYY
ncbi:hypothetical protein A2U01_0089529, partial [Trifolium medium]|nr:hypothetical protein [Trifolium medium]